MATVKYVSCAISPAGWKGPGNMREGINKEANHTNMPAIIDSVSIVLIVSTSGHRSTGYLETQLKETRKEIYQC